MSNIIQAIFDAVSTTLDTQEKKRAARQAELELSARVFAQESFTNTCAWSQMIEDRNAANRHRQILESVEVHHRKLEEDLRQLGEQYKRLAMGDFAAAEQMLRSALKQLGDNPIVARACRKLATVVYLQRELAEKYSIDALNIFKAQRKYYLAEKYFTQALNIFKASLGSENDETKQALKDLVSLLRKLGRNNEAAIVEKTGEGHAGKVAEKDEIPSNYEPEESSLIEYLDRIVFPLLHESLLAHSKQEQAVLAKFQQQQASLDAALTISTAQYAIESEKCRRLQTELQIAHSIYAETASANSLAHENLRKLYEQLNPGNWIY